MVREVRSTEAARSAYHSVSVSALDRGGSVPVQLNALRPAIATVLRMLISAQVSVLYFEESLWASGMRGVFFSWAGSLGAARCNKCGGASAALWIRGEYPINSRIFPDTAMSCRR